jgi:hypothetical protein
MKLPQIKKASWEKRCYPKAKWVVIDRRYNTYDACETFGDALRYWLWHLGLPGRIVFNALRCKKK